MKKYLNKNSVLCRRRPDREIIMLIVLLFYNVYKEKYFIKVEDGREAL